MIIFILNLLLIFFILLHLSYRSCRRTILEKHVSAWSRLLSSRLRSVIILGAKMIIWWGQISWFLSSRQLNSKSLLKKEQHKRVISSLSLVKLFQAKSKQNKQKNRPTHPDIHKYSSWTIYLIPTWLLLMEKSIQRKTAQFILIFLLIYSPCYTYN